MTNTQLKLFSLAALCVGAAVLSVHAEGPGSPGLVRTHPGRIYYTENGRILEINTQRQRVEAVSSNIAARGLLVDGDSRLYASSLRYDPKTDLYRPRVWRLGAGGGTTEPVIATARGSFSFSEVVDTGGNLYFWQVDSDRQLSRILIKRKNGEPEVFAGHRWGVADGRGPRAQISQVGSMTIAPDGCLYFTDHQCVRKVDVDGNVTTIATGGQLGLGGGRAPGNHLAAIAVDENGEIFVADRATQRIFRVTPKGEVETLTYNTDQWIPAGLAWSDGALYVLERGAKESRVVRVARNGQRETLPRAETGNTVREPPPIWLSDHRPLRPSQRQLSAFLVPEIALGFE